MEEHPGHPWEATASDRAAPWQCQGQFCSFFSIPTLFPRPEGVGTLLSSPSALHILSPTLSEALCCRLLLQSRFPWDTSAPGGPAPSPADQTKPKKPPVTAPSCHLPSLMREFNIPPEVAERGSCASSRYSRYSKAKGPIPGKLGTEPGGQPGGCLTLPHPLGSFPCPPTPQGSSHQPPGRPQG